MATKANGKAGRAQRALTPIERQGLIDKIEAEKAYRRNLGSDLPDDGTLGTVDVAGGKSVSSGKIDARVARLERVLEEGTLERPKAAEAKRMEVEAKELEAWIKDHALTRKELDLMPRHGYEYHAAVRKSQKSEVGNPDFAKKCERYRHIQAMLHPDDPEATSIDKIRKPY